MGRKTQKEKVKHKAFGVKDARDTGNCPTKAGNSDPCMSMSTPEGSTHHKQSPAMDIFKIDSDESDLEAIPSLSRMKKRAWNSNVRKIRHTGTYVPGQNTDKLARNPHLQALAIPNTRQLWKSDGKEFIVLGSRSRTDNPLLKQFLMFCFLTTRSGKTLKVVTINENANEYMMVFEKGDFVASLVMKLEIQRGGDDDTFQGIKEGILGNLRITQILKDELRSKVATRVSNLVSMLQEQSVQTSENPSFAQNFFYLRSIVSYSRPNRNLAILKDIQACEMITQSVRDEAKNLEDVEKTFEARKRDFQELNVGNVNDSGSNIHATLRQICSNQILNHRKSLLQNCFSDTSKISSLMIFAINGLDDREVTFFFSQDVRLFTDLANVTYQIQGNTCDSRWTEFVCNTWNDFIELAKKEWREEEKAKQTRFDKIKNSLPSFMGGGKDKSAKEETDVLGYKRKILPLTNQIFLYAYKSFLELTVQISSNNGKERNKDSEGAVTLVDEAGEWRADENESVVSASLARQKEFAADLMQHFKVGASMQPPFSYRTRSQLDLSGLEEGQKVWFYLLDDALKCIQDYQIQNSPENDHDVLKVLSNSMLKGYLKFIRKAGPSRFETFRLGAHKIAEFAARISPYLTAATGSGRLDQGILKAHVEIVNRMLGGSSSDNDDLFSEQFKSLIDLYIEYWELRQSVVGKLKSKAPANHWESRFRKLVDKVLELVQEALGLEGQVQVNLKWLRHLNEFLKLLRGVDFSWYIKKSRLGDDFSSHGMYEKVGGKENVKVLNAEELISSCVRNGLSIPDYSVLNVLLKLLSIVSECLKKSSWSSDDSLNAAAELILVIGGTFKYLNDIRDYEDFHNFETDSVEPFQNLVRNTINDKDFKTRLESIENFYIYARRLDEISIENALSLYAAQEGEVTSKSGFDSDYHSETLKTCYGRFLQEFEKYIKDQSINSIILSIREQIEQVGNGDSGELQMKNWSTQFKTERIPGLLAALAAIWSIKESKDVASTGRVLKPHCIQILCIFRLLGCDSQETGVDKHLAQVLTGQGKSIVLGLLSSLLALLGHSVEVMCFSDYLAKRDKSAFSSYFRLLQDLAIEQKINYCTFSDMANRAVNPVINGQKMNLRSLVENLLLSKLEETHYSNSTVEGMTNTKSILLIDEVDVFFSDKFYGSTYNPCVNVDMSGLLQVQEEIWRKVSDGCRDRNTILESVNALVSKIQRDNKGEDREMITFLTTTNEFFKVHLQDMINTAISVATGKDSDWCRRDFRLDEDGFITCKRSTDELYDRSYFQKYYNIFNYFRLKKTGFEHKGYKNYGYLQVACGSISYAKLPEDFPVILGVTGTLTGLNDWEKKAVKSYGINSISSMPSFFGRTKLKFDPSQNFRIEESEAEWLNALHNAVEKVIRESRAVMVFFKSEKEIGLFQNRFESSLNRVHVLTGNESESRMEMYVAEAGVAGQVTLGTRLMGRGVDYKSKDSDVEKNGGVHVIQSFFSLDEKEETQIKGRTARNQNNGSYELILWRDDLKNDGCSVSSDGSIATKYEQLCTIRNGKIQGQLESKAKEIEKSEKKHNKTMTFLKSFYNYKSQNRNSYFHKYPLKQEEEED